VLKRSEESGILLCWRSFLRCAYVKVKVVWVSGGGLVLVW